MKTLIVYYSLEGNTEYAVNRITQQIDADTLRLVPVKPYKTKGLRKFLWGGRSAMMAEKPKLQKYDVDLFTYDRVIFGFPVWASNFTPPLRTFIEENREGLEDMEIAAFACQSGGGAEKALARLCKFLEIDEFEAEAVFIDPKSKQSAKTDEAIDDFCDELLENDVEYEDLEAEEFEAEDLEDDELGRMQKLAGVAGVAALKSIASMAGLKELSVLADLVSVEDLKKLAGLPLPLLEKAVASVKGLRNGGGKGFFSHWNYKKHAKFCTAVYLGLYAIDMTLSYIIIKKILDRLDEKEELKAAEDPAAEA